MSFEEWWAEQVKNDVIVKAEDYDGEVWDYPLGDKEVYKEIARLAWTSLEEIKDKV